jgi:hypothetical protein
MLALTFIKGPLVDDWAADQVQELESKVHHPTTPVDIGEESLWNDFKAAFDANYADITKKTGALNALYQLHMQKGRFDDYVAAFKHYAQQAEYDLSHAATIRLFAMGIEDQLLDAILRRETPPETIPDYITAAHAEVRKYQNCMSIRHPGSAKYQWIGAAHIPALPRHYGTQAAHAQVAQRQNQRYTHPNDRSIPMDVDPPHFAQIRRTFTEAEKQDHRARGACFRCGRQGHIAFDCPTRKEQHQPYKPRNNPSHSFPSRPPFQKKPFGQRPSQGNFRKSNKPFNKPFHKPFNKPFAYNYVQQARAATIEEIGQEDEQYGQYEQYKQEDVQDLAARTARLNDEERTSLMAELNKTSPDF